MKSFMTTILTSLPFATAAFLTLASVSAHAEVYQATSPEQTAGCYNVPDNYGLKVGDLQDEAIADACSKAESTCYMQHAAKFPNDLFRCVTVEKGIIDSGVANDTPDGMDCGDLWVGYAKAHCTVEVVPGRPRNDD